MDYQTLKWIHIMSSTLLFGTGLGSAFYKWTADRSGNLQAMAHTNRMVVIADWLFTTPTIVIQPVTGLLLASLMGFSWTTPWLALTYVLYGIAGGCWLSVVWLQIKMRDLSQDAVRNNQPLDKAYGKMATAWFWLGVPAFFSMVAVYFLMVYKPSCPIFLALGKSSGELLQGL